MDLFYKVKDYINKTKADPRLYEMRKHSVMMAVVQGISMFISLLMVPLLLRVFDNTNYGIWLTLTSVVNWFSFCDIGLGNGARNKIGEALAIGDNESVKGYISSSYFCLFSIGLLLIAVYVPLSHLFNWASILNAPSQMSEELNLLMLWVMSLFSTHLFLKFINSIFYSLQKPAYVSIMSLVIQVINYLTVYMMSQSSSSYSLVDYGIVLYAVPNIVMLVFTLYLFATKCKTYAPSFRYIHRKYFKTVIFKGSEFFVIQITSVALFQTTNILISQYVNPSAVAEYNIAFKYFSTLGMLYTLITTPFWSATTDAYVRGDFNWIKRAFYSNRNILFVFYAIAVVMLLISSYVFDLWVGESIKISWSVTLLVFIYQLLSLRTGLYCACLNGIGKVRLQFYITFLESLLYIPLACLLGNYLGIKGILLSLVSVAVLNNIWEPIQLKRLLTNTATGLWNR